MPVNTKGATRPRQQLRTTNQGFPSVFGFFFLFPTEVATERRITDDQYSNRRILSVMPSVKMLPTNVLSYTDGMNPSVKLFNSVVFNH
jgi:hypothetical protein